MNLPFFIARRYMVMQKGGFSSFIIRLAIIATALSVAVMILAIAFITGFKYTVREKLFTFLGNVHIETYNPNHSESLSLNPIKSDPALVAHVLQTPHVTHVYPFVQRPAILQAHGQMEGLFLKGVDKDYVFSPNISFTGNKLNYTDTQYSKQIILSQSTAARLNVNTGDSILLYFLEPGVRVPRIRKVQVTGIFHTGMEELDKYYGITDMRLLQRVNNWKPNEISGYQLELDNEQYSDTVANGIYERYLTSPLTTYTIRDIYPNIFDWLDLQNINGQIIIIIMALVAIINLATALMILIMEQARMLGILQALGMSLKSIQQIFLYYAGIIAGVGILAGNLFAFLFCWLQVKFGFLTLSEDTYYMKHVPVRFHLWQIAIIDGGTLILCILCMWLPTLYIRRIRPARVLQFK
ncbi:MAG: ABC transporter permease [Flavipsychrobacter sp.]|nr:ABC transporter permease [Flavipsychrobacter sp.]